MPLSLPTPYDKKICLHRILIIFVLGIVFPLWPPPIAQSQPSKTPLPAAKTMKDLLTIEDPWIRQPAPGQKNAALYGTLRNLSPKPITITGLFVSGASHAEFHQTQIDASGISTMKPLSPKVLAPGESFNLTPGGSHGMIMDLKRPYEKNERIPGKIQMDHHRHVEFEAQVRP